MFTWLVVILEFYSTWYYLLFHSFLPSFHFRYSYLVSRLVAPVDYFTILFIDKRLSYPTSTFPWLIIDVRLVIYTHLVRTQLWDYLPFPSIWCIPLLLYLELPIPKIYFPHTYPPWLVKYTRVVLLDINKYKYIFHSLTYNSMGRISSILTLSFLFHIVVLFNFLLRLSLFILSY